MELNAILKEIKMVKGKPDAKWNKGSANLRAKTHPAKLSACEKELEKGLGRKENEQQKAHVNVIAKGGQNSSPIRFQNLRTSPHGSGFRVKE